MKLSQKKGGNGYISSYTVNISLNDARRCGFVDENGTTLELEKIIDAENKTIIIRLKREGV